MFTINEMLMKKIGKCMKLYNRRNPNNQISIMHHGGPIFNSANYVVGIYDDGKVDVFERKTEHTANCNYDEYHGYFTNNTAVYIHYYRFADMVHKEYWNRVNSYCYGTFVTCQIQEFVPLNEVRAAMCEEECRTFDTRQVNLKELESVLKYAPTYFAKSQAQKQKIK